MTAANHSEMLGSSLSIALGKLLRAIDENYAK
jgi:hypothetical protein